MKPRVSGIFATPSVKDLSARLHAMQEVAGSARAIQLALEITAQPSAVIRTMALDALHAVKDTDVKRRVMW